MVQTRSQSATSGLPVEVNPSQVMGPEAQTETSTDASPVPVSPQITEMTVPQFPISPYQSAESLQPSAYASVGHSPHATTVTSSSPLLTQTTPVPIPTFSAADFRTWKAKSVLALKILRATEEEKVVRLLLALPPEAFGQVAECTSVHEVMERLETIYQPVTKATSRMILERLISTKLMRASKEAVDSHIVTFLDLYKQAVEVQVMPAESIAIYFLRSLPEELALFRHQIETLSEIKPLEIYDIVGRLRVWVLEHLSPGKNNESSVESAFAVCTTCKKTKRYGNKNSHQCYSWCVDSGASRHICNDRHVFTSLNQRDNPKLQFGDGRMVVAKGVGRVSIELLHVDLKDVIYCPDIAVNLISVACLMKSGCEVSFVNDKCLIRQNSQLIMEAVRDNDGLFHLVGPPICDCPDMCLVNNVHTRSDVPISTWHRRLGHASIEPIQHIEKGAAYGGPKSVPVNSIECDACRLGKAHALPHTSTTERQNDILELVHTDICGPLEATKHGEIYFATFIDDFSRMSFVYPMRNKSDIHIKFKEFKAYVETNTNKKIKAIRSDRAREYEMGEFGRLLREFGIVHELTAPYSPEQNGTAERLNRTLLEKVRTMLIDSKLAESFWDKALNFANYARNRTPSQVLDWKTPYEMFYKKVPNVRHLRAFGCKVFVLNSKFDSKLSPRSQVGIFMGYTASTSNYVILTKNGYVVSKDVNFIENELPGPTVFEENAEKTIPALVVNTGSVAALGGDNNQSEESSSIKLLPIVPPVPETYKEAIESEESQKWTQSMKEEYESLQNMGTWSLEPLPAGCKALDNKWVFAVKTNEDGSVERYKARLVVKGFLQRAGVDYDETYATVASLKSLRLVLTLAATEDMEIHQIDVKTAFLNGDLPQVIYMKQPKGFESPNHPNYACKLQKSLYGLKQAPLIWQQTLSAKLKSIGYTNLISEECLYAKRDDNGLHLVLCYVDDILILSKTKSEIASVKKSFKSWFDIHDKGEVNKFLGLIVERDRRLRTITLSQENYITELISKFKMQEAHPATTPMEPGLELPSVTSIDESLPFRELVGSLMYLMVATRPDIAFAVSKLSRFYSTYSSIHWEAAKRVLRYLKGTCTQKLCLGKEGHDSIVGYADSDWATDKDTRRSVSGSLLFWRGSCISWKSRIQSRVALSTTEAEYVALTQASTECIYIKNLLSELKIAATIKIKCDNQGAIHWATDKRDMQRAKHVALKYHFIRELTEDKTVQIEFCPTIDQLADIATKGLPHPRFKQLISMIFQHGLEGC